LNQAAINFFKREKFGTYNHTINLYSVKQIENHSLKHDLYRKLQQINSRTQEVQLDLATEDSANRANNRVTVGSLASTLAVNKGQNQRNVN
jgi:hypothetical protein